MTAIEEEKSKALYSFQDDFLAADVYVIQSSLYNWALPGRLMTYI